MMIYAAAGWLIIGLIVSMAIAYYIAVSIDTIKAAFDAAKKEYYEKYSKKDGE